MKVLFLLATTLLLGQSSVTVVDLYLKDQPKVAQEISKSFQKLFQKQGVKAINIRDARTVQKSSLFAPLPALFKQIKTYIKQENYPVAMEFCQQGLDLFGDHFPHATDFYPLFKLLLYKAYIHNLQGEDDESKQAMKDAVAMGYNYDFDGSGFSPRFMVKYKRLRKRSKRRANKNMQINTLEGFHLYVDGIKVGKTPTTVSKLLTGKHYVALKNSSGEAAGGKVVTVKKGRNLFTLKPGKKLSGGIANKLIQQELTQYKITRSLHSYLKKAPGDYILFGAGMVRPKGINTHIYLYRRGDDHIIHLGGFKFDRKLLMIDLAAEEVIKKGVALIKGGSGKVITPAESAVASGKMYQGEMPGFKKISFKREEQMVAVAPVKTTPETRKNTKIEPKNTAPKKGTQSGSGEGDEVSTLKKEKMEKVSASESIKNENTTIDLTDVKDDPDAHKELGKVTLDLNRKPVGKGETVETTPFYKTWWFWTITGVVVVGGATGTYFLMDDGGSSGKTSVTVHW